MVDVEPPGEVTDALREHVAGSWLTLVALGVGAYVAGIVLTAALAFVGEWPSVEGLQSIGFAFYSAHTVPVVVAGGGELDFLGRLTDPEVPIVTYYAVPVLVLLVAGAVASWRVPGRSAIDPVAIGVNSLGLAVGYVAAAVLGRVAFTSGVVGVGGVSLPLGRTVLFATAYVLAFATIGAAVAIAAAVVAGE